LPPLGRAPFRLRAGGDLIVLGADPSDARQTRLGTQFGDRSASDEIVIEPELGEEVRLVVILTGILAVVIAFARRHERRVGGCGRALTSTCSGRCDPASVKCGRSKMASNTNLALEDRPLRHVEGVAQALMPLSVARTDLVDELSATGSGRVQAWRIARGEIDLETMLDMTVKALGATHG